MERSMNVVKEIITKREKEKKVSVPEGTHTLESKCFANTDIIEITFPKTLTEINKGVCSGCSKL